MDDATTSTASTSTTAHATEYHHSAIAAPAGAVAAQLGGGLVDSHLADVGQAREKARQGRLRNLAITLGIPMTFLWWKFFTGDPVNFLAGIDLGLTP